MLRTALPVPWAASVVSADNTGWEHRAVNCKSVCGADRAQSAHVQPPDTCFQLVRSSGATAKSGQTQEEEEELYKLLPGRSLVPEKQFNLTVRVNGYMSTGSAQKNHQGPPTLKMEAARHGNINVSSSSE